MRKSFIVALIFCLFSGYTYGQTSTCAQTLRLARSTYEQGRFHEIPALLNSCLTSAGGFSKQEKVEALRILTLSYIYQEEPLQADDAMLTLLNTDHYFEINENVDPAEFTALYKTFRTTPIFAFGLKFGGNFTMPTPFTNYYVGSAAAGVGDYSPAFNIQFGVAFEKVLFERNPEPRWTAAPEIFYTSNTFGYANESLTVSDQTGTPFSFLDGTFDQKRLDLNLLVQYKLSNSAINPYVTGGANISYLLSNELQVETQFPSEGSVVTGPPVDIKDTFKAFDYGVVVGGGIKYKFGEIFLTADVRYRYGITNLIKESDRSNPEATFDYGFVSNNLRQSNVIFNIGFIYPYFNPKKLLK